jgi:hypothetical protein
MQAKKGWRLFSFQHVSSSTRQILHPTDRQRGSKELHPPEKGHAFLLLAALLAGKNPEPYWESYWAFGYGACAEHNLQALGGLYERILTSSNDKVSTFEDLWKSLERGELVGFLDRHSWPQFRTEISGLESFLKTAATQRETVYRLVPFLRSDHKSPSPCLVRDYGFKLCKGRPDVTALKTIYRELLEKITPLKLHDACVRGELLNAVDYSGIQVAREYRRLLTNMYPTPGLGYEGVSPGLLINYNHFNRRPKNTLASGI